MAKKRPKIVTTRAEVAKAFGVKVAAVADWLSQGMPGKPSRRGVPGEFRLAEIDEWLKANLLGPYRLSGESSRQEINRLQATRLGMQVARERREIIDLEPVVRLLKRRIGEAKALLEQLPDRVAAEVGAGLDDERREHLRKLVAGEIRNVLERVGEIPQAEELSK
jgi:phage terminase Nu1 subunit (DNA packaging protein)